MALKIIRGSEVSAHDDLMDQAYRLRHTSFVEELKWSGLASENGRERDQFDHDEAVHLLEVERGQVAVYSRLLPTTRPHLLSDVYPELSERGIPSGPNVLEWTRFTVAPAFRGDGRWSFAGGSMVRSVVSYCLFRGVDTLTLQGHPMWITRFLRLGFSPRPLGLPRLIDGQPVVAIEFPVTEEVGAALAVDRV